MTWPQRLRNIALSQLRTLKERLDRIDAEIEDERLLRLRARSEAERELAEMAGPHAPAPSTAPTEPRAAGASQAPAGSQMPSTQASPLSRHYKVLGVADGATLAEVDAAYRQLIERCSTLTDDDNSEDRQMVSEIRTRVEEAYSHLREALNPAAGRFDKLEL